MKILSFFLIGMVALPLAAAEPTEGGPRVAALQEMIENEKKFFEMGQEQGTRAAFLHFLAEDGIIFQPGPVNGKQTWSKRPDKGISLTWKPVFGTMARSADLGYTTGPAEWRKNKEDAKPFGYGQFISIWRKQKDGNWKVALDVGSEVPGPPKVEEDAVPESWPTETEPDAKPDATAAQKALREAGNLFAAAAKADSTIGLTEASEPNVRVLREGVYPAVGKYPAQLMLSVRRGQLTLERMGGGMSEAGDLAYSYGKYRLAKSESPERGHYLQIWRTDGEGAWKIALDYQAPLPPEEKK